MQLQRYIVTAYFVCHFLGNDTIEQQIAGNNGRPDKQPDASNEKWKMVVKLALYVISGYGNQVVNWTMHKAI